MSTNLNNYYKKSRKGKFIPENIDKYLGDASNIVYRSTIEAEWFLWFDQTDDIISWASEPFPIKYKFDSKEKDYWFDVLLKIRNRDSSESSYICEIKPNNKLYPPVKKRSKYFLNEIKEFRMNYYKWYYAYVWCEDKEYEFGILNEKNEFIMGDALIKLFKNFKDWEINMIEGQYA